MNPVSNLPPVVREILSTYEFYLVGGSVRDILLDKTPSDYDLTGSDIARVLAHFKKHGKIVPLDEKEGEYRVVLKNFWIDVSRMKGKTIVEDLQKRDFTINSLAIDKNGNIIDPCGGRVDLKNGIIKTFKEENLLSDPLRILRAFRFYATLGYEIEKDTLTWIKKHKNLLGNVSGERIHQELILILSSQRVYETFKLMCELKVMDVIFPCVKRLRETAQRYYNEQNLLYHSLMVLKYLEENLQKTKVHTRPVFMLGAFLHDIGKPLTIAYDEEGNTHFHGHDKEGARLIEKRLKELKFSNREIDDVKKIIEFHMYPHHLAGVSELTKKAVARFLRRTGEYADFLLYFAEADAKASPPREGGMTGYEKLRNLIKEIREESKEKPPRILTGYDLIELGFEPSPLFRVILEDVEDEFKAGTLKNKEDALQYVKKKYKQEGAYDTHSTGNSAVNPNRDSTAPGKE